MVKKGRGTAGRRRDFSERMVMIMLIVVILVTLGGIVAYAIVFENSSASLQQASRQASLEDLEYLGDFQTAAGDSGDVLAGENPSARGVVTLQIVKNTEVSAEAGTEVEVPN